MTIGDGTLALRLLVAVALGGVLGIERESREQPAGLRTHILVSTGACLFTIVSAYGFASFGSASSKLALSVDPTRVASQIVVGIGFLGGGAILRHGATVKGLTTAASLWVTAAIGMSAGIGMYFTATLAALIALIALAVLKPLERRAALRRRRDEPPTQLGPD